MALPRLQVERGSDFISPQGGVCTTLRDSNDGTALAELAVCLPLLGMLIVGLLEFGHVRTVEYITTTAAYVGAAHAASGRDGAAAATQYMKDNGLASKGTATDKDAIRVSVDVSHHVSIVNYWEARVRYAEPSTRRLRLAFPKGFEAARSYRWYVSRSYSKKGSEWAPVEPGVTPRG